MFPAFVIQNLWVCSVASLQEMYSVGVVLLQFSICAGRADVYFCAFRNSESVGVHSSLPARNVASELAQAVAPVYVWVAVCFLPS